MVIDDETTVYHVMSRTALDGFPLGDIEKDFMLDLIRRYSTLYFVEILGFCLMGNHFHLLVKTLPEYKFSDQDIKKRYVGFYGNKRVFADGLVPSLRAKLSSLSEFVREIKVGFARYYNKKHNRRGYFWGDRFKSVIVDKGETLINCLAYIDLNPLRAGIVSRPEDYRWNSLGYRTRYFTDSGVIGSKEFVSKTYMRFKHHFNSKNEKKPKPIKGLSGVYSLKRLAES
jgi:REP element-mobilizing transposase RayT